MAYDAQQAAEIEALASDKGRAELAAIDEESRVRRLRRQIGDLEGEIEDKKAQAGQKRDAVRDADTAIRHAQGALEAARTTLERLRSSPNPSGAAAMAQAQDRVATATATLKRLEDQKVKDVEAEQHAVEEVDQVRAQLEEKHQEHDQARIKAAMAEQRVADAELTLKTKAAEFAAQAKRDSDGRDTTAQAEMKAATTRAEQAGTEATQAAEARVVTRRRHEETIEAERDAEEKAKTAQEQEDGSAQDVTRVAGRLEALDAAPQGEGAAPQGDERVRAAKELREAQARAEEKLKARQALDKALAGRRQAQEEARKADALAEAEEGRQESAKKGAEREAALKAEAAQKAGTDAQAAGDEARRTEDERAIAQAASRLAEDRVREVREDVVRVAADRVREVRDDVVKEEVAGELTSEVERRGTLAAKASGADAERRVDQPREALAIEEDVAPPTLVQALKGFTLSSAGAAVRHYPIIWFSIFSAHTIAKATLGSLNPARTDPDTVALQNRTAEAIFGLVLAANLGAVIASRLKWTTQPPSRAADIGKVGMLVALLASFAAAKGTNTLAPGAASAARLMIFTTIRDSLLPTFPIRSNRNSRNRDKAIDLFVGAAVYMIAQIGAGTPAGTPHVFGGASGLAQADDWMTSLGAFAASAAINAIPETLDVILRGAIESATDRIGPTEFPEIDGIPPLPDGATDEQRQAWQIQVEEREARVGAQEEEILNALNTRPWRGFRQGLAEIRAWPGFNRPGADLATLQRGVNQLFGGAVGNTTFFLAAILLTGLIDFVTPSSDNPKLNNLAQAVVYAVLYAAIYPFFSAGLVANPERPFQRYDDGARPPRRNRDEESNPNVRDEDNDPARQQQ